MYPVNDPSDPTDPTAEATRRAIVHLGSLNQMISGSKTGYHRAFPTHLVLFNSNVCTREHGKIWHGDLDVTASREDLRALARELGVTVYVLCEMDGRFEHAWAPRLDRAEFTTDGDADVFARPRFASVAADPRAPRGRRAP